MSRRAPGTLTATPTPQRLVSTPDAQLATLLPNVPVTRFDSLCPFATSFLGITLHSPSSSTASQPPRSRLSRRVARAVIASRLGCAAGWRPVLLPGAIRQLKAIQQPQCGPPAPAAVLQYHPWSYMWVLASIGFCCMYWYVWWHVLWNVLVCMDMVCITACIGMYYLGMSCPSWQWHRTGSRWSPVRTLPVAPLWCDLGFVQKSRGYKAAANLCPICIQRSYVQVFISIG